MGDSSWREVFINKSIHDIRQVVYDTRQKAAEKKSELRGVVSHRELLKTAITVVEMRDVLEQVEGEYRGVMEWGKDAIDSQVKSAKLYSKGKSRGGENVRIASAVAFVKACFDVIHHQSSLLLSAKALLAARLALNTLPKNSHPYFQYLRDRFTSSRARLLKQADQALLHAQPLEALQSYAFITGSSSPEVLQHFLTTRLTSISSSLNISSPDSLTIIHIIHATKSTIADIQQLFPFHFQRSTNELKLTPLLRQEDLHRQLLRKRGTAELWITPDLQNFLIWTKSEILDSQRAESMLNSWQAQINTLLKERVSGLFKGIEDLDSLCTLRNEIISALISEGTGEFEMGICSVLVKEIAEQITRIIILRVRRLHELETMAKEIIDKFNVEDVNLNVWDVGSSRNLKLDQILSMKTARERPGLKDFATSYQQIMGDILSGETRLQQVQESNEIGKWERDEISNISSSHKEIFEKEIESFSENFTALVEEITQNENFDEIISARLICWLRLISIIQNPPISGGKADLMDTFAKEGRLTAQSHLSKAIASQVEVLTKQLLDSRSWTEPLPEQKLWEGMFAIVAALTIDEPKQPTRIPLLILKDITTQLNSFGVNLLNKEFVFETNKRCAERISSTYDITFSGDKEISSQIAMQLLADVLFLCLTLASGSDAFRAIENTLLIKVRDVEGIVDRLTSHLKVYQKRTSLLFGILNIEEEKGDGA